MLCPKVILFLSCALVIVKANSSEDVFKKKDLEELKQEIAKLINEQDPDYVAHIVPASVEKPKPEKLLNLIGDLLDQVNNLRRSMSTVLMEVLRYI